MDGALFSKTQRKRVPLKVLKTIDSVVKKNQAPMAANQKDPGYKNGEKGAKDLPKIAKMNRIEM